MKPEIEILEADKRLSDCMLWRLQEDFYTHAAVSAWQQVPYYPTSNAFIGEAYAELAIAFLMDCAPRLNFDEPVYIIELAAGMGYFSAYMIQELLNKKAHFSRLKPLKLRYIMTDFTDNIVKTWLDSDLLQPFLAAGVLDFAVYAPEIDEKLFLQVAQQELTPASLVNPMIGIANYFFDSIRQDLFRVDGGALQEARLTFFRETEGISADTPVTLAQLRQSETYHMLEDKPFSEPAYNRILQDYQTYFDKGSILFPTAALRSIAHLQRLSNNKLALISSDKGFTNPDYMEGHYDYKYSQHGGAFSFMVNYDAIGRHFTHQGGEVFSHANLPLTTFMGVVMSGEELALDYTRYCFQEHMVRKNPINNLYHTRNLLFQDCYQDPALIVKSFLAFLQLCSYDQYVLFHCVNNLNTAIEQSEAFQPEHLSDFLEALHQIDQDVYGKALFFLGNIQVEKQNDSLALHYFKQALPLLPGSQMIQENISQIETRLGRLS